MVAVPKRFLSFSPPSVTMAFISSLPLHLDCLLLVSHKIPLMRPPQVDVLLGFFYLSSLSSISNGLGLILCQIEPNHSLNLLWQGYLSRAPTLTFQNTTHQIIYFILLYIRILFPYQFFIIISNHHSLTRPKTTAFNLNNF